MGVTYLSPAVQSAAGSPVAARPIAAGDVVAAFGGRCVPASALGPQARAEALQIEDDLYLVSDGHDVARVPHSCEPTCELSGSVVLVARRAIAQGEALTFDHGTAMGDESVEFACACGAPSCRGTVTGRDWMQPELQLRYRGHFSPFLARRISALVGTGAERRAFAL